MRGTAFINVSTSQINSNLLRLITIPQPENPRLSMRFSSFGPGANNLVSIPKLIIFIFPPGMPSSMIAFFMCNASQVIKSALFKVNFSKGLTIIRLEFIKISDPQAVIING